MSQKTIHLTFGQTFRNFRQIFFTDFYNYFTDRFPSKLFMSLLHYCMFVHLTLIHVPLSYLQSSTQPPYLHNLISIQCPRSTRSSSVVTLARPPLSSSLKITDRSFHYASPCLWNQLPFLHVNLSLLPVLRFPTHPFLHPSLLPLLIHHSVHL